MALLPWPVRIYIAVVTIGTIGLTAWQFVGHGLPSSGQLPLAGLLALCMMLAWIFPLPVSFKTHFYLDTALLLACVLLFEPGAAMLICGVGTLGAQIVRRRTWDEALFNAAQTMLQAALAGWFLRISGFAGGEVRASDPRYVATVLVAGVMLFVAAAVLVGTIVALQGGLNPIGVWLSSIIKVDDAVYLGHGTQIALAIVVAVLGSTYPWTILMLVPSVAAAYLALRNGFELRQQASLALRLQEKNLTEAQRLARIGSWEWDLTTGAHGWSEEAFRILGYGSPFPKPSLDRLIERVHPDDREALDGHIHAAIRYQSSFDVEHRVLGPGDEERMVHHRGEVVADESGQLRIVAMIHDVSEQKSLEAQLEHLAFHDQLTGLFNRPRLVQEIEESLHAWQHGGKAFALFFVDLDGFKGVNDTYGHKAGDEMLIDVARRLTGAVRGVDIVARFGGDEFVVLARSVAHESEARRLSERLLESLSNLGSPEGSVDGVVTASIGVVMPRSRLVSSDELLQQVDTALYYAKRNGKNQFALYGVDTQDSYLGGSSGPTFSLMTNLD